MTTELPSTVKLSGFLIALRWTGENAEQIHSFVSSSWDRHNGMRCHTSDDLSVYAPPGAWIVETVPGYGIPVPDEAFRAWTRPPDRSPPPPPPPRDDSMDRFWSATGAVRLRGGWFGPRLEIEQTRTVDRRPNGAPWSPGWFETEFRWRRARADELSIPLREATGPSLTTIMARWKGDGRKL